MYNRHYEPIPLLYRIHHHRSYSWIPRCLHRLAQGNDPDSLGHESRHLDIRNDGRFRNLAPNNRGTGDKMGRQIQITLLAMGLAVVALALVWMMVFRPQQPTIVYYQDTFIFVPTEVPTPKPDEFVIEFERPWRDPPPWPGTPYEEVVEEPREMPTFTSHPFNRVQ